MNNNTSVVKTGDYVIIACKGRYSKILTIYAGKIESGVNYDFILPRIDGKDEDFLFDGDVKSIKGEELECFKKISKAEYLLVKKLETKERNAYIATLNKEYNLGIIAGYDVTNIEGNYIFGCGAVILTKKELELLLSGYEILANLKFPKEFVDLRASIEEESEDIKEYGASYIVRELTKILK